MLKAVAVVTICLSSVALCQVSPVSAGDAERIVGAAMTQGGAMQFVELLSDRIGGRLTGSPESVAAANLILRTLKDAGLGNARIEEYPLEMAWKRGPVSASIISPVARPIYAGSYGWAPGTNGPVEARVVEATMSATGKWDRAAEDFRGAAVMVNFDTSGNTYSTNYIVLRARAIRELASAGAVAMLIPSDKPHRMLYTSAYAIYPRAGLPVLSIAKEDALFVRRLMKKEPVKLHLNVRNDFFPKPGNERNVLAEIPGTSNEIVLLGAHFDSWDPAQGANDNGSGVAAVLEAARILRSLGVKPKATIRFAFFSGEEQGCLGSRAYADAHKSELDRYRVFILMDGGAQMPVGLALKGRHDLVQPLTPLLPNLQSLGADHLIPDGEVGSDDETFLALGIPAIELMTEPGDYDANHHAITDTLDKIDPRALAMDTAALALTTLAIANADNTPGRRLSPAETLEFLTKAQLLEGVRATRGSNWVPQ